MNADTIKYFSPGKRGIKDSLAEQVWFHAYRMTYQPGEYADASPEEMNKKAIAIANEAATNFVAIFHPIILAEESSNTP